MPNGSELDAAEERQESEARWSDWMRRAQAGDASAYHELLGEVALAIERYLRRRFGDRDFVEECVQECLLSIHRARATYDARRPFRPWLFAIVRHKAIDLLRKRGTRGRYEEPLADAEPAAPAPEPLAALEAARLLQNLEAPYREALVLTKLQGLSLEEAAAKAGITASAMKTRVHRAIRRVRRALEQEAD